MDSLTGYQAKDNIELLYELKEKYNYEYSEVYNHFSNRVTRVEYSKGGLNNSLGYYSFDLLSQLIISNYHRGKLYNSQVIGYNYKYSFEGGELIMLEKFNNGVKIDSFFIYYDNNKKIVISYGSSKGYSFSKPQTLMVYIYDDLERLRKSLYSQISNKEINNYEENVYEYNQSDFIIRRYIYHSITGTCHIKDFSFPLSALTPFSQDNEGKVTDHMLKRILKKNFISVLESWSIINGYAISLILHNPLTVEIDYSEEFISNQEKWSEHKWDYTYWNQHSTPLLKDEKELNIFKLWLEQCENVKEYFSLTENERFVDILLEVINEIRNEGFIKKAFGNDVPIIVTNFDLDKSIYYLNIKLNDSSLLEGYLKWFNTFFE